jgi:hypothetical protein
MISWIYFYFFMNLFCLPFLLLRLRVFNSEDHSKFILVSLILVGCRNFGGLRRVIPLRLILIQMIISFCFGCYLLLILCFFCLVFICQMIHIFYELFRIHFQLQERNRLRLFSNMLLISYFY